MSNRKQIAGKNLVLGDYVTVQVPSDELGSKGTSAPSDILVQHEDFFQRIQKELGKSNSARQKVAA
jgi:sRNA-binding carbon storage regulator CsrA